MHSYIFRKNHEGNIKARIKQIISKAIFVGHIHCIENRNGRVLTTITLSNFQRLWLLPVRIVTKKQRSAGLKTSSIKSDKIKDKEKVRWNQI